MPLVGAVLAATLVQGLSSYALVQLLSRGAQQLITEMRVRVQDHVGRLPVSFHDAREDRRAGLPHHERRRRGPEPHRHRPRGDGRGPSHRGAGLRGADVAVPDDDPAHRGLPGCFALVSVPGPEGPAPHLPPAQRDLRRGDRAPDGVPGWGQSGEGLPRRGPGGGGVRRGRPPDPRERLPDADHDLAPVPGVHRLARGGRGGGDVPGRPRDPRRAHDDRGVLHVHDVPRLPRRPLLPDRGDRKPAHRGPGRAGAHPGHSPGAARGPGPATHGGSRRGPKAEIDFEDVGFCLLRGGRARAPGCLPARVAPGR